MRPRPKSATNPSTGIAYAELTPKCRDRLADAADILCDIGQIEEESPGDNDLLWTTANTIRQILKKRQAKIKPMATENPPAAVK